jgi:hypothetical protein
LPGTFVLRSAGAFRVDILFRHSVGVGAEVFICLFIFFSDASCCLIFIPGDIVDSLRYLLLDSSSFLIFRLISLDSSQMLNQRSRSEVMRRGNESSIDNVAQHRKCGLGIL